MIRHLTRRLVFAGLIAGSGFLPSAKFARAAILDAPIAVDAATVKDEKSDAKADARADATFESTPLVLTDEQEKAACLEGVTFTTRKQNQARLQSFCKRIERLPTCASRDGRPIQHSDFLSKDVRAKRVLVFGSIHGDESLAGEMTLEWSDRLESLRKQGIEPRNTWRVIPMLNPDGMRLKTRMNANGVDLNRNFPTKDWSEDAVAFWKSKASGDARRFPGKTPASEPETRCAIQHIKEFKPDFIISVHTPYKVLDFDGPMMSFPRYKDLPWRALGNFPGSLGRYMWRDYQVPVLTVELGQNMVDSAALQDILGSFTQEAVRRSGQKTAGVYERL